VTTSHKHDNFTGPERHISNEAYRRYLLDDENTLYDENGEFSGVNMIKGMLAKMYEEDGGPERVRKFLEEYEQNRKKQQ